MELILALLSVVFMAIVIVCVAELAKRLRIKLRRLDSLIISLSSQVKKNNDLERKNFYLLKDLIRISKKQDLLLYRQVETLVELNSLLGFNVSGLRNWAISPDAAIILYKEILKTKPNIVLELGGGISSVIIAQALQANKKGRLVSVDHLSEYAKKTQSIVEQYGLKKFVEVRTAELTKYTGSSRWYSVSAVINELDTIDFLVVDGPPAATNKNARMPAVPVLKDKLSKSVTIFMDDFDREEEQAAAESWLKLLPDHKIEVYETEKGAAILRSK